MATEWLLLGSEIHNVYGDLGFLQADLLLATTEPLIPALSPWLAQWGISYSSFLDAFSILRWIALFCFTVGILVRPATITLWLMQIFLMSSGGFSNYGVDRYFHVLLFFMMFMPLKKETSREAGFSLRVLQLAILIIYFDAGVSKTLGHDWWSGDAIWRSLHLPEFRQMSFLWMAEVPWLPRLLGWGTVFLEMFYIVGVWRGRIGVLWTLSMMGLHLGIALFLGLYLFGATLILVNIALFLIPHRSREAAYLQTKLVL